MRVQNIIADLESLKYLYSDMTHPFVCDRKKVPEMVLQSIEYMTHIPSRCSTWKATSMSFVTHSDVVQQK